MEFIRFCFESPWHYFGILIALILLLSMISEIVKSIALVFSHQYTPINYYLPNVTKLNNDIVQKDTEEVEENDEE
jgi:hypothetical protein